MLEAVYVNDGDDCVHYHLQVQANSKKIAQKNQCYFYQPWEKRDCPKTFFLNSQLGLSNHLTLNEKKC